MTVADKIRQSVKGKPRPRLRKRVKKADLWDRQQRLAMAALAEQHLKDRRDGKEI